LAWKSLVRLVEKGFVRLGWPKKVSARLTKKGFVKKRYRQFDQKRFD
jgi:hypothetical protein